MKFIELKITRQDGIITITAKSPILANIITNYSSRYFGVPPNQLEIRTIGANSYWENFQGYATNGFPIRGINPSANNGLYDGPTPFAPWLLHKNLATGMTVRYLAPATVEQLQTYASNLKSILSNYFDQNLLPFEIELEIVRDIPGITDNTVVAPAITAVEA